MSDERAFQAEQEVGRINAFFPILPRLGNHWAATRPWEGRTIGLNLHITSLTATLLREMVLGGGTFVVSAANTATTDHASVDLLRGFGIDVYTGGDMRNRHLQVLDHNPDLLVDVGFELLDTLLDKRQAQVGAVQAAIEITRSGITRLRKRGFVPFPVVNINDGRLKSAVENRHGVGEGIWQAVSTLTGMHLAGRRALVVGYGSVGRGIAAYGRSAGLNVEVAETDPIRRLYAHYDGFPTPDLVSGLARASIVVTATGATGAVSADQLAGARDGVVVLNAGHGGDELDITGLQRIAENEDHIADRVVRYQLPDGPRVTVLGDGHPLNIVLNSGSPEPVLLHFGVLGLALAWLADSTDELVPGEILIPEEIERRAAVLALDALDPSRD